MKRPLIIAVNGSPNRKGNTAVLLAEALETARERGASTRWMHCVDYLQDLKLPFCAACSSPCAGKCFEGHKLVEAFELLSQADGLLIGSPVYFGTVSAQLKAFWDKTRSIRASKGLLNVVGGALTVGGSRFGGQETTLRAIHDMMLVQGMIIVGDGHIEDDCGHQGAAAQRPASEDEWALSRCRIMGKRITDLALSTRELRTNRK